MNILISGLNKIWMLVLYKHGKIFKEYMSWELSQSSASPFSSSSSSPSPFSSSSPCPSSSTLSAYAPLTIPSSPFSPPPPPPPVSFPTFALLLFLLLHPNLLLVHLLSSFSHDLILLPFSFIVITYNHAAKAPPIQRKPLKHRDYEVDLESRLGKTQVRQNNFYNVVNFETSIQIDAFYFC